MCRSIRTLRHQDDPPTTGEVTDARGSVVIQLAREYRRVVTYDEVPLVVRHAILARSNGFRPVMRRGDVTLFARR